MRLRLVLFVPCLTVVFSIVFAFYFGDPFCRRPESHSYFLQVAVLSSVVAAWDFLVGALAAATLFRADSDFEWFWLRTLTTTVLAASGFAYLPFWIYRGYGVFRFHDTWADISCFFTEGYGIAYLFFLVPILAVTTFAREAVLVRLENRSVHSKVPPSQCESGAAEKQRFEVRG